MEDNDDLKQDLITKLDKELTDFKQDLIKKQPSEIIDRAYELVVKQEIIDAISDGNYSKFELKTLLKRDDLLQEFYNDWLHSDGNLRESLEYCVEDSIDIIRDDEVKRQKNRDAR